RTRSSIVSICGWAWPKTGGCVANGGRDIRAIEGVASSFTFTAAGGIPSTAKRWTTRDDGVFTETTYSVDVGESDCTGAKLERLGSGPDVVKSGWVDPASSSCLLTTHSSLPTGREP